MNSDGLVIKVMDIGENDKVLTILTRDFGLIRAFSSGSKKIGNKKFSASTLLTYANFSFVKVGDNYKIYEATTIESFFEVGSDIELLALSQYICELAIVFSPTDTSCEEYLRLFLNSLFFIVKGNKSPRLIKSITELRLAAISGYMPDLVACNVCAKFEDDIMYFQSGSGKLYCSKCKTDNRDLLAMDRTVLSAMRHIIFSPFNNLYKFEIPDEKIEILSNITEKYVSMKSEHKFLTLEFYENIRGKSIV